MSGVATLKQLRKEIHRLRVENNALRIVVQGVADYYRCDDEGELPEDAHGGDWEACWKCQATRALESPGDFRMASTTETSKGGE